jgi:hypothetical protein
VSLDCPYNFQGCDTGSRCRCQEDHDQQAEEIDMLTLPPIEIPVMSTGYSDEESGYNGK